MRQLLSTLNELLLLLICYRTATGTPMIESAAAVIAADSLASLLLQR